MVMRQEHRAGEKLFVDYAGQALAINPPSPKKWSSTSISALFVQLNTRSTPSARELVDYFRGG